MFHLAAHGRGDLFADWREAAVLWAAVTSRCPGLVALVLMPDHVHLQHPRDVSARLGRAMSSYARWRNAQRGEAGPVWMRQVPPEALVDEQKVRRSERYIHLNPCRARLVADPLAWPFSTHRDAVGLAVAPVRRKVADPVRYHRYVSGDPSAAVQGTDLPMAPLDLVGIEAVELAASAVLRVPLEEGRRRGALRTLTVRAARCLTDASAREIAAVVGMTPRAVRLVDVSPGPDVACVARVLGDVRFPGLASPDPRLARRWRPRRLVGAGGRGRSG